MKDKKILSIIVVLAAVAVFLGGSTFTKWQLQKGKEATPVGQTNQPITPSPAAQRQEQPSEVLGADGRAKIEKSGAGVKGLADAPIIIVEFSEYECPFCKRYVDETYSQLMSEYGDKIYYLFHDYPLPFHSHAQKMAEVARCAGDQEKYWEMHDLLFAQRDKWASKQDASAEIDSYAEQLGLDTTEFDSCLSSGKFTQAVKDDLALGQSVGVQGTPTFFINGQRLVGAQPLSAFKNIIDAELE